jgi:hypothetical protein
LPEENVGIGGVIANTHLKAYVRSACTNNTLASIFRDDLAIR